MTIDEVTGELKPVDGLPISYAVLMVVLGVVASILCLATGIGVAAIVAWAMLSGGVAHLAYGFAGEHAQIFSWRLAIGILYVASGFYLVLQTSVSLSSLNLILAAVFCVEGALRMLSFFQSRSLLGALWISLDGVVAIVLGFLVSLGLPDGSSRAISALVGMKLCVSGVTRLVFSLRAPQG